MRSNESEFEWQFGSIDGVAGRINDIITNYLTWDETPISDALDKVRRSTNRIMEEENDKYQ